MNDNFLLHKYVKQFSFEMMRFTNNIPRNLTYLRDNIQKSFNNAIKQIKYYTINISEPPRIKMKYLKDLVVELSMLDYYLECLFVFKALGKNQYNNYAGQLEEIRKLAYGVINSEKK